MSCLARDPEARAVRAASLGVPHSVHAVARSRSSLTKPPAGENRTGHLCVLHLAAANEHEQKIAGHAIALAIPKVHFLTAMDLSLIHI